MSKDHDDRGERSKSQDPELEFSLEDILAEYSSKPRDKGRVVPFPAPPQAEEPDGTPDPEAAAADTDTTPITSIKEEDTDAVPENVPDASQSEPEPSGAEVPAPHRRRRLFSFFHPRDRKAASEETAEQPPIPPGESDPPPPEAPAGDEAQEAPAPKPSKPRPSKAPNAPDEAPAPGPEPPEKLVYFPGEDPRDKGLGGQIRRLKKKADAYADQMFQEEDAGDAPEVRRAERYIPGVDVEEPEDEEPPRPRRPRRMPPPAPDLPPKELFQRYSKGLGGMKLRVFLLFLLSAPLVWLAGVSYLGIGLPAPLAGQEPLLRFAQAGLLGAAMLIGIDGIGRGLKHLLFLRPELDSVAALSCFAVLADALLLALSPEEPVRQPYCAAAVLSLALGLWGELWKRRGLRVACRTAASASEPYLVTLDEHKWNAKDTFAKWSGEPIGFGRQIQAPDGAQRIYHIMAPLILIAAVLFAILSSIGRGRPQDLIWALSATLTAGASLSSGLCYGIPWRELSLRLAKSGAALAGWDGVCGTGGSAGILLTDQDLFPPGTVGLNGIKIFGDFPVEKVVGVTATMIRDSGCGLDKIFHDLLRTQGAVYRRTRDFTCYEGGGVSAEIRDQSVLVGSAAFMHLMEVPLPQGLHVKNAVFCAIDGELAGIFALKYTLHGTVEPSLHALIRSHIVPVLATRDFSIIPEMLRQRFKLPADKMEFPPVARRVELSSPQQAHSEVLTAVLCREGVGPFTEAAVGARRLRKAVRLSAGLTCLGSCVGVLLAFYLTFMGAYLALSPFALLVFLAMWLVPTVLISHWVTQY